MILIKTNFSNLKHIYGNHIKMKLLNNLLIITLASAIGYGCSSSSGGGTPPSANGIYSGTISDGHTAVNGIEEKGIIYNGRLLVVSLKADGIQQFFDATFTTIDTSLTGTGERYDNISLQNSVTYNGSFSEAVSATISFGVTTGTTGNPGLVPGTMNLTASTALLAKGSAANKLQGTWTGSFGSGFFGTMDLTIDATGTITAGGDQSPLDCVFSGSITPEDTSINVYNVAISSDGGTAINCSMTAGTYTGLAWTEGDTDGTLILMFADGTKGRGVVLTKN